MRVVIYIIKSDDYNLLHLTQKIRKYKNYN